MQLGADDVLRRADQPDVHVLRPPMRAALPALAVFLLVALSSDPSEAEPQRPREAFPHSSVLWDTKEDFNKIQFICNEIQRTSDGRRRINCDFAQVIVSKPPTPQELAKKAAEDRAELEAEFRKNPAKFWKETCGMADVTPDKLDTSDMDESERATFVQMLQGLSVACKTKQFEPFAEILGRSNTTGRKASTCSLSLSSFSEELVQVDANTWAASPSNRGICGYSFILTLWRDDKEPTFWNYRQVRTPQPTAQTGLFCNAETTVRDFRWNAKKRTALGCQYVD